MKKRKENMKKSLKLTTLGFTLIELLAVIAILALIIVLSSPQILETINKSKISVFKEKINTMIRAGSYKCADMLKSGYSCNLKVTFNESEEISTDIISDYFYGEKPNKGNYYMNDDGDVSLAIWDEKLKVCAYKDYIDEKFILINLVI